MACAVSSSISLQTVAIAAPRPSTTLKLKAAPHRARVGRAYGLHCAAAAHKVTVIPSASEDKIKEMGCRSWPTWGCSISKFPWSYGQTEVSLLLEGEVVVTPDGGEPVTIKAGDIATFPAGMSCTWDVKKTLKKHYNFR